MAQPVFRAALEKSEEINQALLARNHELEAAGYHAQVKVTPSHTLCFCFEDGARTPVRHQDGDFFIGERKLAAAELLQEDRTMSGKVQRQRPVAASDAGLSVADVVLHRRPL